MIAQTSLVKVPSTQQGTSGWGQKGNMVQITSVFHSASHRLPLCLLYPSHPRAFPNHHSFPSNTSPPQPFLSPQTKLPDKRDKKWKSQRQAFLALFHYVFIGCTDLPLDPNKLFASKTYKSIMSVITIFITDKKISF
jgi:hypothetical protein